MIVVGGGDDEHILEVRFLDGPQELLPPRQLLQALLGDAQRQIDDFATPAIDGPLQRLDHRFHFAGSSRPEHIGGK
jgi:hypothetical protein